MPRAKEPGRRSTLWQVLLLLPHPPLSLLYLTAVREERIAPSFTPLLVLGAFPVFAALASTVRFARSRRLDRVQLALAGLAAIEVGWAVLALAMAGFTIAWRSG